MPLDDLAGEAIGGIFRVIGRIFAEVFFEFLIKGTGYALIRGVRPSSEPSETACAIVGLMFWGLACVGGYLFYRAAAA